MLVCAHSLFAPLNLAKCWHIYARQTRLFLLKLNVRFRPEIFQDNSLHVLWRTKSLCIKGGRGKSARKKFRDVDEAHLRLSRGRQWLFSVLQVTVPPHSKVLCSCLSKTLLRNTGWKAVNYWPPPGRLHSGTSPPFFIWWPRINGQVPLEPVEPEWMRAWPDSDVENREVIELHAVAWLDIQNVTIYTWTVNLIHTPAGRQPEHDCMKPDWYSCMIPGKCDLLTGRKVVEMLFAGW